MYLRLLFPAIFLFCLFLIPGCSGGDNFPSAPELNSRDDATQAADSTESGTRLRAYYDVRIDPATQTVDAVPNRNVLFTGNVTNLLNNQPDSVTFTVVYVISTGLSTDISLDISITHPFTGMPRFNGYDVRGVFMGNGSASLETGGLIYPVMHTDQMLLDADGYTRWFNQTEFNGSKPLFSYTDGILTPPGYSGNATLCGYKYFTDGIGKYDIAWDYLVAHYTENGVFSSGNTSTRNFTLRFLNSMGVTYGYAVIADWEAIDVHPSNTREAVACKVFDNSDVYYVDSTQNGGDIRLDIAIVDWLSPHEPGLMEDYRITLESTVLSQPYIFNTDDMTVYDWSYNWCSFQVEIPADDVKSTVGNEFWIIVEYPGFDYSNPYGVMNDAWDEPLKAYFRYSLYVSSLPPDDNHDPVCYMEIVTPMPATGWDQVSVECNASASYDPDPGDVLTFSWDFDGDGMYGENPDDAYTGSEDHPVHAYTEDYIGEIRLKLDDGNGGVVECSKTVDVSVRDSTLFYWNGEDGTGDPLWGENGWAYVGGDTMAWDDNGDPDGFFTGCLNTWLIVPEIEIPAESMGDFRVCISIKHWGGANPPWLYEPNTQGFDSAGYLGYRIGWGLWTLNSDTNPWLTHHSGNNFNADNPSNLALGGGSAWCSWLGEMGAYIWEDRCFAAMLFEQYWGSESSPWDSTFTMDPSLKGELIQFGFYWAGLEEDMGKQDWPGWCIREIEIYVVPE